MEVFGANKGRAVSLLVILCHQKAYPECLCSSTAPKERGAPDSFSSTSCRIIAGGRYPAGVNSFPECELLIILETSSPELIYPLDGGLKSYRGKSLRGGFPLHEGQREGVFRISGGVSESLLFSTGIQIGGIW